MDGAAGPEQDHLPEAAFRHEGGEPGLPFIEVAAKVHALFPGGEEAITRIEAYAPGVKAAVLQMLLQMTEERHYRSAEHKSELKSLMSLSYAVFFLNKQYTYSKLIY